MSYPSCPKCNSKYTYEDMWNFVCLECGNEWPQNQDTETEEQVTVKDTNGQVLNEGDRVSIVKDLKLGKDVLKKGTVIKNIRILDEEVNGHNIEARVDGFGNIYLKGEVVKKLS